MLQHRFMDKALGYRAEQVTKLAGLLAGIGETAGVNGHTVAALGSVTSLNMTTINVRHFYDI